VRKWASKPTLLLIAAVAAAVVLSGCGGGGGASAPPINDQLFTPNYISSLNLLLHWNHLPARVSFLKPADFADYGWSATICEDAAAEWNQSGKQALTQVVPYGQPADVVVEFVSRENFSGGANSTGITNASYNTATHQIVSEAIQITPVKPPAFGNGYLSSNDAQVTIAHEIGHALGIQGHSPYPEDLMHDTFNMGQDYRPTTRDFNTVMTAYPNYFLPGQAITQAMPSAGEGKIVTVSIE